VIRHAVLGEGPADRLDAGGSARAPGWRAVTAALMGALASCSTLTHPDSSHPGGESSRQSMRS